MPPFLSDPPQVVYIILGGLLVVTGLIAAQRQDRRTVAAFAVAFFLILLVFLIDRVVESPREEAERRTILLAMSADAKNPDAFADHLADKVTITTGMGEKTFTREELKNHPFWNTLRQHQVAVSVKNFSREDSKIIDDNTVEIGFMGHGTPRGMNSIPVYVRATYSKQSDGSFKLTAMKFYEPIDHTKLFSVPGFP